MQRFEITVDGAAHSGIFATQAEAEAAANSFRASQPGKTIATREKQDAVATANDGLGTVPNVDPAKVMLQKDGVIFEQQGLVEGQLIGDGGQQPVVSSNGTISLPGATQNPPAVGARGLTPSTAPAAKPSNIPPAR